MEKLRFFDFQFLASSRIRPFSNRYSKVPGRDFGSFANVQFDDFTPDGVRKRSCLSKADSAHRTQGRARHLILKT